MNVTFKVEKRPVTNVLTLDPTPCIDGREFDVKQRLESILIRLGPYDNSDFIRIEQDDGEVRILVPSLEFPEGQECIFSTQEEEP